MLRPLVFALVTAVACLVPAAPVAAAGATTVCTITDPRVIGLSGLIVTKSGYIGVSDSNIDKSKIRIWYVDQHCKVVKSIGYPTAAYDPEDAAIGHDGTLYVSDSGDNARTRASIAVWRLAPGASTPKIFRYRFPDGPHDTEAILLAADDSPIFVTKDPITAGVYVPTGPADPSGRPVPLRSAGTVPVHLSDTPNGLGALGSGVIDGGAQTPDRTKVALRTYADAYEWAVPDGDVIAAITGRSPTITPLANEPFGESIAYAADGKSFYTVSDLETDPVRTKILRYPSALPAAGAAAPSGPASPGAAAGPVLHASSSPTVAYRAIAVAVALGAALIGAGIVGVVRARRRA